MTITELAKKADISLALLSRILSGQRSATRLVAEDLAAACDGEVTADEWMSCKTDEGIREKVRGVFLRRAKWTADYRREYMREYMRTWEPPSGKQIAVRGRGRPRKEKDAAEKEW